MARQVRPWLTTPVPLEAPRVRVSDQGVNQRIPSGTVTQSHTNSPNVRVQSLPSSHELSAWQTGRVHVRVAKASCTESKFLRRSCPLQNRWTHAHFKIRNSNADGRDLHVKLNPLELFLYWIGRKKIYEWDSAQMPLFFFEFASASSCCDVVVATGRRPRGISILPNSITGCRKWRIGYVD